MSHVPSRLRALVIAGSLLAVAPTLGGCIVAAAGAGAAGGYGVLGQELSPEQQVKDSATRTVIRDSWGKYNQQLPDDLDATVYNGRVLITGRVPQEEWRQQAVKLAWKADGVKEVYDEVEVGPATHFMDEARDTVISTRLRNDLVFDKYIKSINYTVTTNDGVVYVIGTARSQQELNRVTDYARNIPNVRRVVSYVRIRSGEPETPVAASGASPAPAAATPNAAPPAAAATPAPAASGDTPEGAPTPRSAIEVTPLK
ncbi:MAG TPA: BON domain-containing protein [Stellaceae bacterium]|nr:BON domain-containing protein [Stellaceae bacterium]